MLHARPVDHLAQSSARPGLEFGPGFNWVFASVVFSPVLFWQCQAQLHHVPQALNLVLCCCATGLKMSQRGGGRGDHLPHHRGADAELRPFSLDYMSPLLNRCCFVVPGLKMSNEVADVVNTFRIIAELPADSMGAYVISMARSASDVLAVVLLQRECGVTVSVSCWSHL